MNPLPGGLLTVADSLIALRRQGVMSRGQEYPLTGYQKPAAHRGPSDALRRQGVDVLQQGHPRKGVRQAEIR